MVGVVNKFWSVLPNSMKTPDVEDDPFWRHYINSSSSNIHVAILSPTYLSLILQGRKSIESRFSLTRRLPYNRVQIGDVILLKQVGGPIEAIAYAEKTWYFELVGDCIESIRQQFSQQLSITDEKFWHANKAKKYASLIELCHVVQIPPVEFKKRDRNAWVLFDRNSE